MSKKQFVVKSVNPRSVNGPNGQFTAYDIIADDGFKCSSTNAAWMNRIGQAIEAEVEERSKTKNGITYKNFYVIEEKKINGNKPEWATKKDIEELTARIEGLEEEIMKLSGAKVKEINETNLPF